LHRKPRTDETDNPLISIFIYDYNRDYLEQCFQSIFSQELLDNIEIIFTDNASTDDSWKIALKYAINYDGIITLKRNKKGHYSNNQFHSLRLAKGKYYVTLTGNDAFVPEYIKSCLEIMETDASADFKILKRIAKSSAKHPNSDNQPLVSILIPNYNYGRYLRQCLDSAILQPYSNIEIIISDNASTDDSWNIIVEYTKKYPDKVIPIRNRSNFGPNKNFENCYDNINGKYFFILCSDDAIKPKFIEKSVQALEAHNSAGFAMAHRCIIDENGLISDEPPFYNQSCIIPGAEQAAVFMMAAVNPCISQIMYNYERSQRLFPTQNFMSRWFLQRTLDFNLCCEFDMVYLKEPLLINRVHSASDSSGISNNLVELFGQYILPHQFAEIAMGKNGMTKAIERLPKTLEKLSVLSLRYSTNALINKDEKTALRYFNLALVMMPEITSNPTYITLHKYWSADALQRRDIIKKLESIDNLTSRNISYNPPPGSVSIDN